MALFKISRGGESNMPPTISDGWAYFTPDTKGFFIDVNSTIGNKAYNERIEINEKNLIFYAEIKKIDWDLDYQYKFTLPKAYSSIDYDLQVELDESQMNTVADLFNYRKMVQQARVSYVLSAASQGVVFTVATLPTESIYLKIILIPKKRAVATFKTMYEASELYDFSFYLGSTWREFATLQPDTSLGSFYLNNDGRIVADVHHPSNGSITVAFDDINLDDFILANKTYTLVYVPSANDPV